MGLEDDILRGVEAALSAGTLTGLSTASIYTSKTPFDYMRAMMVPKKIPRIAREMRCSEFGMELVKVAFSDPHFITPKHISYIYGVRLRVDDTVFDYAVESYDQKGKLMEITDLRFGVSVKVGGEFLL